MRRTLAVVAAAAIAGAVWFSMHSVNVREAEERDTRARTAHGRASAANEALLASLPAADGVRFSSFQEVEGPLGGVGRQWQIVYATDGPEAAREVVARHAEATQTWRDVQLVAGCALTARDGDRYLAVIASEFGEHRTWGVAISINALDGELYGKSRLTGCR